MADIELSSMAKTGLKQAEMGLLVLYGAGYFNEEEWIRIDGLLHKGKYEFTSGPPRHLLDGFDSPLLEANDKTHDSLSVAENDIGPIELGDGKSVVSEDETTGQDIWDQSPSTEHVEPTLSTPVTSSAFSSKVDITSDVPRSTETAIHSERQSDTVVNNDDSYTENPIYEQYPDAPERYISNRERRRERNEELARQANSQAPQIEGKLAAIMRNPSRHLQTRYKVPGKPINIVFVATRAFNPEPDMQLTVRPGDHLQIIKYIVKEWYFARNLRTKLFGQYNQDVVQAEPYSRVQGISLAEFDRSDVPINPPRKPSGTNAVAVVHETESSLSSLSTDPAILRGSYKPGQHVDAYLIARRPVIKDHAERIAIEVGDPIRIQRLLSGITFTGVNVRTKQHGQVHRDVFDEPDGSKSQFKSKPPHAPTSSRLRLHDYEPEAAMDWQDDAISVSGSVRSDARNHTQSSSPAMATNMPWRSTRVSGLQQSVYADPPPARNASPASVMSAQEIERLVNRKVAEVLNEKSPASSPAPSNGASKTRLVCWWWATPGRNCRYEEHDCQNLHYYPVDGVVAPQPGTQRQRSETKPAKMLTCWFWHNQGHCDNSEEKCKFSHRWTGEVADKPFWIRSKKRVDGEVDSNDFGYDDEDELDYGDGEEHPRDQWERLSAMDPVMGFSRSVDEEIKSQVPASDYDEEAARKAAEDQGLQWW